VVGVLAGVLGRVLVAEPLLQDGSLLVQVDGASVGGQLPLTC
jgi:hypothetical protein